jgi:hypothetical protein
MLIRRISTTILIAVVALPAWVAPAWGAGEAIGSVIASRAASVRETKLTTGSSVFSGDAIFVGKRGSVRIALRDGAQVEIIGASEVRLLNSAATIQIAVDSGQVSFRTPGGSKIEGLLADATIRPADLNEASAIIESFGDKHSIIAARKGTLLVTTLHDSKTLTVHEGEAADLSAAPATATAGGANNNPAPPPKGGRPIPAGRSIPRIASSQQVIWVGAVVAGQATIAGYLLARQNPTQTGGGNAISPSKVN